MHGEVSDAKCVCDLNVCGGYDSGTCDGGSSTTASEMSESVAALRGGHRRGKRAGRKTPTMRRARAATREGGCGLAEAVAANDDDK